MDRFKLEFHHAGVLVSSTEQYLAGMPRGGRFDKEEFDDPVQLARLTLVQLPGYYLELIEPQKGSRLEKELITRENLIHHLCFILRDQETYLDYKKNSIKVAGPFFSIMFNAEIEFYLRANGIIEEIVKKF
jgi:hypothetical protein